MTLAVVALPQGPLVKLNQPAPKMQVLRYVNAPVGTPLGTEGFRGSVVVLEFWATWCGPCIQAIPHLNELTRKFADRPVKFLSLSNESYEIVSAFAKKQPFDTLVGSVDEGTWTRYVANRGVPLTVILDREGKVFTVTHPSLLEPAHIEEALSGKRSKAPTVGTPMSTDGSLATFTLRPADPTRSGTAALDFARGRYIRTGISIRGLVSEFWKHPHSMVEVDDKLPAGRYDIQAILPNLGEEPFRATVKSLVSASLGFDVLLQTHEREVLVLRCPDGLKAGFKKSSPDTPSSSGTSSKFFDGTNMPMDVVAGNVEIFTNMPVLNETKIAGNYDFRVTFESGSPESLAKALAPSGLTLLREKRKLDILTVRPRG
jgi:uncharacterized protein (TIGR03435 family)